MRSILLSLLLISSSVFGWEQKAPRPVQECAEFVPYGAPVVTKKDATTICRVGYLTVHDNVAKIPVYGAYVLKPENALGCQPRTNAFAVVLLFQFQVIVLLALAKVALAVAAPMFVKVVDVPKVVQVGINPALKART
jgi:hypothetical protein